jgi:threonine dehydratase
VLSRTGSISRTSRRRRSRSEAKSVRLANGYTHRTPVRETLPMPDTTHDLTLTLPDLAAIRSAATRIAPLVHRTPVLACRGIDAEAGAQLHFKCENFQRIGAFKARGAANAVFALADADARNGVVTHSSGNHGAAVAYAARARGIPAWIVMPENAARVKQENVRRFGATIRFCAPTVAAREQACAEVRGQSGATLIHPFDNADVIAGQGTAALELLDAVPDLDIVIAPVGGGGLLSGTAIAVRSLRPSMRVYGAEPANADDATRSFRSGRVEPLPPAATIADGLRTTLSRARSRQFGRTLRRSAPRAKRRSCGRCG